MNAIFSNQIRHNLKIYIDNLVVKTSREGNHCDDLEEILKLFMKYDMHLSPSKLSFGVQASKSLSFMLTRREIYANLDKC